MLPAEAKDGARNWYGRGQNFIIAFSVATKGAALSRAEQPDEYVVLLPDPGAGAEIVWGNERITVAGHSITFVPAGKSSVTLLGPAKIWRGWTFMVNFLDPKNGPRDTSKMSPHHHDDFEQCSLALAGTVIHHMRWLWTPDMGQWREDTHERCDSLSIAVIPPPAIHMYMRVSISSSMSSAPLEWTFPPSRAGSRTVTSIRASRLPCDRRAAMQLKGREVAADLASPKVLIASALMSMRCDVR
jgi:hypothetical protein